MHARAMVQVTRTFHADGCGSERFSAARDVPPHMKNSSLWVSPAEAASTLGVSKRLIWTMISDGRLPACRISRQVVRINRADLDALLVPIPHGGIVR